MSPFNQDWFNRGRLQRLKAQLTAYQTSTAVILPMATHNATAFCFWRDGWNSVSLNEIKQHIANSHSQHQAGPLPGDHIAQARNAIKGSSHGPAH
jgi:hypothetical protein